MNSIAQWLEPRPSDPAVVAGADIYVPAILRSRTSWQIKATPSTRVLHMNACFSAVTYFDHLSFRCDLYDDLYFKCNIFDD